MNSPGSLLAANAVIDAFCKAQIIKSYPLPLAPRDLGDIIEEHAVKPITRAAIRALLKDANQSGDTWDRAVRQVQSFLDEIGARQNEQPS